MRRGHNQTPNGLVKLDKVSVKEYKSLEEMEQQIDIKFKCLVPSCRNTYFRNTVQNVIGKHFFHFQKILIFEKSDLMLSMKILHSLFDAEN